MSLGPQNPRLSKNEISPNQDLIEIFDASAGTMKVVTPSSLGEAIPTGSLKIDGDTIDGTLRYIVDKDGTQSPLKLSTDRLGIDADPTVTLQQVAVIESLTTNAGIVLKPNGTGAIMAQVPDGTTAGGNARGVYAVDLQMGRTNSTQVAGGRFDVIAGGENNFISIHNDGHRFIGSGYQNAITIAGSSVIAGGSQNSISGPPSAFSTISGGQSNTASTNTHATVVGGYLNTASGQYSVAGGLSNTASGRESCAIGGRNNVTSGTASATLGTQYSSALNSCSAVIGAFNSRTESNYSAIIGGDLGRTYLLGQVATGVRFSDGQRAQSSMVQAYNEQALSSGGTMNLSLDGTGITNLIGTPGGSFTRNVTVKWIAVCKSAGSGTTVAKETAIGTDVFMFRYDTATITPYISAITSVQSFAEASMTGATCSYSASSSNLIITFTAPSTANNTTFKVLAKVELVEIQL